MKRIIFTTCGTSLYQSCSWTASYINKPSHPFKLLSHYDLKDKTEKSNFRQHQQILEGHIEELEGHLDDLALSFDTDAWTCNRFRDLPAELASLRAIQLYCESTQSVEPLSEQDTLVLCSADNDRANFCAKVLHKALSEKLIPGKKIEIKLGDIMVAHGLDPSGHPEAYKTAFVEFWRTVATQYYGNDTTFYLNLTGGYKPLVMIFACFAYEHSQNATIFNLNEDTGQEVLVLNFDANNYTKNVKGMQLEILDPAILTRPTTLGSLY